MALNADTLLDRIRLKAQLTRWRMLAILFAALLALLVIEHYSDTSSFTEDYVARITIDGIIMDDTERDEMLKDLAKDQKVKAVLLRLDTPGGSAVGGEELYLKLKALSKTKPVVAVMRSMSTSAGYLVALGADRIYARDGTITGSIGVIIELAEVTELAKKIGVTPVIVKSGPFKGSPSMFEKMTPDQTDVVQQVVADFYNSFVDIIAERRQLPHEEVVALADGRIYSGKQAVKLKLVDAIGGEDDAVSWLDKNKKISAKLAIKDVKPKKKDRSFLEKLGDATESALLPNVLRNKLDGLVLIWQPNAL